MSDHVGPGTILIEAALLDEHVHELVIRSSRPVGLARVFLGHEGDDAPGLGERLFTLCGFSHRVAAEHAIASATGRDISFAVRFENGIGLLAERIEDSLRSLLLGWPHRGTDTCLADALVFFRQATRLTQALVKAARERRCFAERGDLLRHVQDLRALLVQLGLPDCTNLGVNSVGFFNRLSTDVADENVIQWHEPDALQETDDQAVVAALMERGEKFSSFPALAGRIIETGPFARRWQEVAETYTILAARLEARMLDIVHAEEDLRASLESGEAVMDLVHAAPFDDGAYAAVESPRGRLYHHVSLRRDGSIAAYDLLAPTEWNFHPDGPLTQSLLGARIGSGEKADLLIAYLTALFDPCVAFRVECRNMAHA